MAFYLQYLFGSDVYCITGKRRFRSSGMESILDVAEETVNVSAGNDQAPLLGLVQLP